jgi:hypothetical protein
MNVDELEGQLGAHLRRLVEPLDGGRDRRVEAEAAAHRRSIRRRAGGGIVAVLVLGLAAGVLTLLPHRSAGRSGQATIAQGAERLAVRRAPATLPGDPGFDTIVAAEDQHGTVFIASASASPGPRPIYAAPTSGPVRLLTQLASHPLGLAADGSVLWATTDSAVERIDTRTGGLVGSWPLATHPGAVSAAGGVAWVAAGNGAGAQLIRLTPGAAPVLLTPPAYQGSSPLALPDGTAYVIAGGEVSHVGPHGVLATGGGQPTATASRLLGIADGALLVETAGIGNEQRLALLDPVTLELRASVAIPAGVDADTCFVLDGRLLTPADTAGQAGTTPPSVSLADPKSLRRGPSLRLPAGATLSAPPFVPAALDAALIQVVRGGHVVGIVRVTLMPGS